MGEVIALHGGDWAARILAAWGKAAPAVLETGRLLLEASKALKHGEFERMCREKLPFGSRHARRLMAIGADERLRTHVSVLPPACGTLYELTRLDDEQFQANLKNGTIRPDMERKDVAAAVKKTVRATRELILGEKIAALPQQKFGVVLADPEWRFEPYSRETGVDRAADNHYPTSETDVIMARDVPSIAADDCALFLWATVPMLQDAFAVINAWGFTYKSHVIWLKTDANIEKPALGTGYWFRNCHELLLVGTKGNLPAPAMGDQEASVIAAPVGEHSAKPDIFLRLIEYYFPNLPKIELNRRGPARPGWKAWGNEAEEPLSPTAEGGEPTERIAHNLDIPNFLRRPR